MKKLSYVKLYETWCLYLPFLFSSSVLQSFFSFLAPSLFGTQHLLTHPPVKSSTLPLRKMPVFQGVPPWHTIFTSPCVIPLWDSATVHSSSGKELNSSSQEDTRFSGRCTLAYNFLLHPASSLFWAQQQLIHPPVKSSTLLLRRIPVFQDVAPWHTIFYFILHHPSLGLSKNSLNLR